jgi:beta-glucosidase
MSDVAPRKGMTEAEIEAAIDTVLAQATLAEMVGMMSGRGFFEQFKTSGRRWGAAPYRAGGGIERLGIAPFWFTDGPRGVARGNSTCFPCTMARGATFDTDLEHRIGQAMGAEIRAQGCDLSGAVCVNLLRHPAWGRAQETYGEDPHHLGAMGAALGTGIQVHNVAATVKHFALNSIENSRFKVDVRIDERTLHEVYLPHFKHILDAGVLTVMSAYNKMNGEYCGENRHLLTDILRGEWGFDGFVHSDWVMGVRTVDGATAGLDVENPEPLVWGDKLLAAVDEGRVSHATIHTACRRILRIWYRIKAAPDPQDYPDTLVACDAHRALALEAAEKSAVLLKNDGVLPFDPRAVRKLAVVGPLADLENTGDNGSSRVQPPYVITPLQGLRDYLSERGGMIVDAVDYADAVVVVAGYTAREEGEFIPGDVSLGQEGMGEAATQSIGGDRANLDLPADQVALIRSVAAAAKPTAVVIVAGSAVMVEAWHEDAGAILQTFYSGMEGGRALARLLFGEVSPSGKLPFTVARDAAHYPFFNCEADQIDYGYWRGYAKFTVEDLAPRYAFGHGLSYASFTRTFLNAFVDDGAISIAVDVANIGAVPGDEVVQCYVGYPGTIRPRAPFDLKAFARVSLQPGETRRVALRVPLDDLRYRDPGTHGWRLEPGRYAVRIMQSCADTAYLETNVDIEASA